MYLVRSILANLCPIMIHFNALDCNMCRSREVMFLLTLSVHYNTHVFILWHTPPPPPSIPPYIRENQVPWYGAWNARVRIPPLRCLARYFCPSARHFIRIIALDPGVMGTR